VLPTCLRDRVQPELVRKLTPRSSSSCVNALRGVRRPSEFGPSGQRRSCFSRSHVRMPDMTKSQATTTIPVQLSGPEFIAFIFPHLSMPGRGFEM
jgi:hypothetical protein